MIFSYQEKIVAKMGSVILVAYMRCCHLGFPQVFIRAVPSLKHRVLDEHLFLRKGSYATFDKMGCGWG